MNPKTRITLATLLLAPAATLFAADVIWTGATSGDASDASNWLNGATAATPLVTDTAVFNNAVNTTVTLPTGTFWQGQKIRFDTAGAGSFTLGGGRINVNSGWTCVLNATVVNNQTIASDLTPFASANAFRAITITNSSPAAITFSGAFTPQTDSLTGGWIINARGANAAGSTIFNGVISGALTTVDKANNGVSAGAGTGTLQLNAANLHTGGTNLTAVGSTGKLVLGHAGALGTGPLRLIGGGNLEAGVDLSGTNKITNEIQFNGSAGVNTTGTLGVTGGTTLNVAVRTGIRPGMTITGTGVPANTTVTDITGNTVTISNPLTANTAGAYTVNFTAVAPTGAAGQNTLTVTNTSGIYAGQVVTGNNLSPNTIVTAVDGLVVTLNNNLLANTSGTNYVFNSYSTPSGSNGSTNGTLTLSGPNNVEFGGPVGLATVFSSRANSTITLNTTGTGVTTFSGDLTQGTDNGVTGLTKAGSGVLVLSGNNTLTGLVTLNTGTLYVNNVAGSGTGSGAITVNTGATLAGTGSVNGTIAVLAGGSFNPGGIGASDTAVFNATRVNDNALVLSPGSTTVFQINGSTRDTGYDGFDTLGRVNYGGGFTLSFGGLVPEGTTVYDLFGFATLGTSDFDSITLGGAYSAVGALTKADTGTTAIWTATAADGTTFSFAQATGDLTVTKSAPPITPLETWRAAHFTVEELANPALETSLWGSLADPDSDGVVNHLEYAFDTLPRTASTVGQPTSALGAGGVLSISFLRARGDLTYIVEASGNLAGAWTPVASNPGTVGAQVVVQDAPLAGETRRFMRIRVTLP